MDSYQNLSEVPQVKDSFANNGNIRTMTIGRNINYSATNFEKTSIGLKKKAKAINALSLSLIGGMIKDQQGIQK